MNIPFAPAFQDNCPLIANPGQSDKDKDKRGNKCDNCPDDSNPNQSDIDGDRKGDKCDNDIDNDGMLVTLILD